MIPDARENIWEHSQNILDLYRRRAEGHLEMDAARQCAEILKPLSGAGIKVLDAGCGSGYLFHSLKKQGLDPDYYGLDYSPSLIAIGREVLPAFGLAPEQLMVGRIEDLTGLSFDAVCLLNTLTFCPDFRAPLDRLCATGATTIIIRDNFGPQTLIRWEEDGFLNPGWNHLKAYWNQWNETEVTGFLKAAGFNCLSLTDQRTQGRPEMVVGKPYRWSWIVAHRSPRSAG